MQGLSPSAREQHGISADPTSGPFPRSTTPGIPGGTSNSDPVNGQAGWYDVRVRIHAAQPGEEEVVMPAFPTLPSVPGEGKRRRSWLAYVDGKESGE